MLAMNSNLYIKKKYTAWPKSQHMWPQVKLGPRATHLQTLPYIQSFLSTPPPPSTAETMLVICRSTEIIWGLTSVDWFFSSTLGSQMGRSRSLIRRILASAPKPP